MKWKSMSDSVGLKQQMEIHGPYIQYINEFKMLLLYFVVSFIICNIVKCSDPLLK